jgi:ribosome biogenesis protein SSF1/2
MYPYTLINLKESKKNNIKDFLSLVDIYGLSHMMMFTNTEKHSYLHFAKMPKGPTVTFIIDKYILSSDIFSNVEKDQIPLTKSYGHIPLLIMNGFNNTKIPEEYNDSIKIVAMMFQSFFPPVNLGEVQIKKFKRVVLINLMLNKDVYTGKIKPEIEFRHYDIELQKYSVKKTISNLINNLGKTKDLSNFNNISDYILKHSGYSSCSDNEEEAKCEILDEQNKSDKTSIKLKEIGPRMNLKIFKIQEGFFKGNVVYHSLIKKSKKEIYEIMTEKKNKEKEKKERQKIQDENIIKKQELIKMKQKEQQENEENKDIFSKKFKEDDEDENFEKNKNFLARKKYRDDDKFHGKNTNMQKKKKKNKLINPEKEVIMTKRSLKQLNKLKKYK